MASTPALPVLPYAIRDRVGSMDRCLAEIFQATSA